MTRALKVGVVVALGALCAGAVVVPRVARARVSHLVDERCQRVLDGTCTIGDVRLAMDGVLLRDLTIRARAGRYTATVRRVGVRVGWTALLFGTARRVDVDVSGVEVRGRAPLAQLLTDLRTRRSAEPEGPRRGRLQIRSVHLTDTNAQLVVTDLAGNPLEVRARGVGMDWARDSTTTSVRWSDVAVEYPGARAHTGACTALDGIDTATSLDCREFEGDIDSARARELFGAVDAALATRAGGDDAPIDAPSDDAPPSTGRQIQVRMQEGRVKVRHGDDVIADLAPATVTALAEGQSLREASFQLGGEDARAPSLSVSFNRMHDPWQVDLDAAALPLRRLAPWVPAIPWHGTDEGRAHARVHVEPAQAPDRLDVSGDLFLENFGLQHAGLAHEPVDGLSVSVDGRAIVDLTRRRVSTPALNWHVNGIPFTVSGYAERDRDHTAVDASLHMPMVTCDGAMRSLPRAVMGISADLGLTGTLSADAHVALDTRRLGETVFDYHVIDGCRVTTAAWNLSMRRFAGPFVQRAIEAGGRMRAFVTGPGAPAWVPIEMVPATLVNAVISREDGSFYRHQGFAPGEIRGALVRNVSEGRFAYGASTISMQLAKNVFLAREKTLVRKLQEVVLTWWLEQSLTKSAILELYLNVVEFGPGIYGIGPAARFFFGREPRDLSTLQSIYLATLLPAPVPRFANFQRGSLTPDGVARLRAIARSMGGARLLAAGDIESAQQEVFAFRPRTQAIVGAQTLTVDAATTDEAARALAERHTVTVLPDDNAAPAAPGAPEPAETTEP